MNELSLAKKTTEIFSDAFRPIPGNGGRRMTRMLLSRQLYVRVTENDKRKLISVGTISKDGTIRLTKGMPLPGWFEV